MNKIVSIIYGLLGLSLVVIVHEFGHFCAAKLFGVAVPLFSIGFGPGLVGIKMGSTVFQLALLPIGGYVAISPKELALQPYMVKLIILSAGILANILFAYLILLILRMKKVDIREVMAEATGQFNDSIIGPIGIISMVSYSAALGIQPYFLVLAALSMGIAMFNLLPIPFFDGGQIAWYTIEALFGKMPTSVSHMGSMVFYILFLVFIVYILLRDIQHVRR